MELSYTKFAIGVDPDLHFPSFSLVSFENPDRPALRWVHQLQIPTKLKGMDAIVALSAAMRGFPWPKADVRRILVEGQKYWGLQNETDPNDLIVLAQAAGLLLHSAISNYANGNNTEGDRTNNALYAGMPIPNIWKGNTPKEITNNRTAAKLNVTFAQDHRSRKHQMPIWPNGTVIGYKSITPANAHHILDAAGIALWAGKIEANRVLQPFAFVA